MSPPFFFVPDAVLAGFCAVSAVIPAGDGQRTKRYVHSNVMKFMQIDRNNVKWAICTNDQ